MKVTSLTTGCHFASTSVGGFFFGCVSESLKFRSKAGLADCKYLGVFLPDTTHARGVNNMAVEFNVFDFLFNGGGFTEGRKLMFIGTPEQLRHTRELLRITVLPPTEREAEIWAKRHEENYSWYQAILKSCQTFLLKRDGRALEIDELVEFVPFDNDGKFKMGDVTVTKRPEMDSFEIRDGETTARIKLTLNSRPKAPFKLPPDHKVYKPLALGVRVITYSGGFDPNSGCTALVVWLNGVPLLWDAAPFVSQGLEAYGLSLRQLGGVILTHVHEDHASILELMDLGEPVHIYTTSLVYESLLIKLAAIMGLDLSKEDNRKELEKRMVFHRLRTDEPNWIYGVEVTIHQCVHSIPAFGATLRHTFRGERKTLFLSGDTTGPEKLEELIGNGSISKRWGNAILNLPTGDEDIALVDGAADRGGLHPNPTTSARLHALRAKMGDRLWFGHRSHIPENDPELRVVKPGQLLIAREGNIEHDDLGEFRRAIHTMSTEIDEREIFALFAQGEIVEKTHGVSIVREGEKADLFWVVLAGTLQVKIGEKEITTLNGGTCFGEMAIVENALRSATVETVSAVRLLAIPAGAFANFVDAHGLSKSLTKLWRNRRVLMHAQIFEALSFEGMRHLAESAERVNLDPGTIIIEEGSTTTSFFVLEKGEAEVRRGPNADLVGTLGEGDVCGERGALLSKPRNASVISKGAVTALRIDAKVLRELAGRSVTFSRSLRLLIKDRRN